jgi:uncharacterized membrane protein
MAKLIPVLGRWAKVMDNSPPTKERAMAKRAATDPEQAVRREAKRERVMEAAERRLGVRHH